MKRRNIVVVFIVILSSLLLAFVWHSLQNKGQTNLQSNLPGNYAQQNLVRGIFSLDVSRRIERISAGTEKSRTVSEDDLDFLLKTSQLEPLNDAAENRVGVHILALSPLVEVRHWTPLQQNKVLASVAPLLASSDHNDKEIALTVVDGLNSQAIPYVEPLTKDTDPQIRRAATSTINRIMRHQSHT